MPFIPALPGGAFWHNLVKDKRKRIGRNPQTGQDLLPDERRVVTFKCSGVLRDKIKAKEFSQATQLKKTYRKECLLGTRAVRLRNVTTIPHTRPIRKITSHCAITAPSLMPHMPLTKTISLYPATGKGTE